MEDFNILPNEAQRIDRIIKEIEDEEDVAFILEIIDNYADLQREYEDAGARVYANNNCKGTPKAKETLINMVCHMSAGTPEQREQIFILFPEFK